MSNLDPRSTIFLMPGADEGLLENMVINIETGYYIQGVGGFQREETMLVTASGYELFTHNSLELAMQPVPPERGRSIICLDRSDDMALSGRPGGLSMGTWAIPRAPDGMRLRFISSTFIDIRVALLQVGA